MTGPQLGARSSFEGRSCPTAPGECSLEKRTGVVAALVIIAGLAGTYMWLALVAGPWSLATGLLDAARHFERAENKIAAQALKQARYETLAGSASARRARNALDAGGPLFDVAAALPTVGDALGEVDHLVRAAELTGEAANGTLDVAQNALRGPNRIVVEDPDDPQGGARIRIDRIRAIADTISRVRDSIDGVRRELEAVDRSRLPARVRPNVAQGIETAVETDRLLADAEAGLEILPGVLGADGPRTYFFGMQNSAELRGPGGALLQFKLLQIVDGKPELLTGTGGTVYNVDRNRQTFEIPLPEDAWYVRDIEDAQRFGNANWSPDWPLSADVTLDYAAAALPNFPEVDGMIAVDPVVMRKLMPGIGQFKTTGKNVFVDEERIVHFVLYKAYASYPIPKVRRNHLEAVVTSFYERLLRPKHPTQLMEGFGSALRQKHMQVWMREPAEQAFIERMNWDGAIEQQEPGDYLYVVEQNVGGNKLDYFARQTTEVDVQLDGDDAAVSTEVTIDNRSFFPQPLYPMGDTGRRPETNGHHYPMMNVYVPQEAELRLARVGGEATRLDTPTVAVWPSETQPAEHFERGQKVWSATLDIPPQSSGSFRLGYVVPDAVQRERGRRVYRLTVQRQPRVRVEDLVVRFTLPAGATAVRAPGWQREGDELVWQRPLKEDVVLEVSWQS